MTGRERRRFSRHEYRNGDQTRSSARLFLFLVYDARRIVSCNWAIRFARPYRHPVGMAHPRPARRQITSGHDKNGDGFRAPTGYDSVPRVTEDADRIVVDDWPEEVPITAAEVDVLETFLGDLLDAFLRPRQ
jgi:hypothetical protein